MKNLNLKKVFSGLFFAVVLVCTFWAVFHDENPAELWFYLKAINDWYLIPAVLCVIAFILGESCIIHYLMASLGTKVKLRRCFLYSFIGFFYSAITPSASGGQPMQVLAMRKDRIPAAVSTVVLAIVTITYKLVLVVLGTAVLLIRPGAIMVYLEPVESLVYLGLLLNVICVALLLLAVFLPAVIRKMTALGLAIARGLRLVRDPDRLAERVERIIGQYHGTADYFRHNPKVILRVFVMTLLQRGFYFCIIWFTYLSFGFSGQAPLTLIGLYAMISVIVDMLPLPGGMGISENLFLTIFEPIFSEALVTAAMVICRGISYYTQLILCAVATGLSQWVRHRPEQRA